MDEKQKLFQDRYKIAMQVTKKTKQIQIIENRIKNKPVGIGQTFRKLKVILN